MADTRNEDPNDPNAPDRPKTDIDPKAAAEESVQAGDDLNEALQGEVVEGVTPTEPQPGSLAWNKTQAEEAEKANKASETDASTSPETKADRNA